MKTTTVAAAAAGLVGTALADSSSGWGDWASTTADPVTTTAWSSWSSTADVVPGPTDSFTWPEWSPSSTDKDPQATTTWADWSATTDDSVNTATWSEWTSSSTQKDPETAATWSEWTSSSTQKDPETTWAAWTSATTDDSYQTSTWSDWSSSTDDSAQTTAWSAWSSTDDGAQATNTWSAWTEPVTTTVATSTTYVTVTVYPVNTASASSTWSDWSASSTTTNNAVTTSAASTWSAWSSSSSTVNADSNTWSAWETAQCAFQVSTSYGQPVWYPTPVLPVSTAAASSTWADWTSTTSSSTNNAAQTSTWSDWSADPSSTWAAWTSSSTNNAAQTSTWAAWTSTSSSVKSATPTSTWSDWSASSTNNPAMTSTWSDWSASSSINSATATSSGWSSWSTGSSSSGGQLAANGNKLGMTYSPYTSSGGCKDQSTVSSDIAEIAALGFASVRVYSTDCNTLEYVGAAAKASGIKVILGVFISNTGISGAQPQVDAIVAWAQWDLVDVIVIGNEAIFNNYCTASELAGFISSSKSAFQGAGYTGFVTTTEELSIWQSSGSELCDVIDITGANLYAFFNAETTADQAGSFIQAEISELEAICPGKDVYAMECGWPSAGECNGVACPSPENQKTALTSIQQITGAKIVFFSFEDEQWKQPGQFGVEQHWGCADVFGASGSQWQGV